MCQDRDLYQILVPDRQKYEESKIRKDKNTKRQKYEKTKIRKDKNMKRQKYKKTKMRKDKNTKRQKDEKTEKFERLFLRQNTWDRVV